MFLSNVCEFRSIEPRCRTQADIPVKPPMLPAKQRRTTTSTCGVSFYISVRTKKVILTYLTFSLNSDVKPLISASAFCWTYLSLGEIQHCDWHVSASFWCLSLLQFLPVSVVQTKYLLWQWLKEASLLWCVSPVAYRHPASPGRRMVSVCL